MIRSYRIEFYFFVAIARKPGASPTRMRGKLARQPTGPTGPFAYMARERQRRLRNSSMYTVFTETVTETDTDEQESNAGNKA